MNEPAIERTAIFCSLLLESCNNCYNVESKLYYLLFQHYLAIGAQCSCVGKDYLRCRHYEVLRSTSERRGLQRSKKIGDNERKGIESEWELTDERLAATPLSNFASRQTTTQHPRVNNAHQKSIISTCRSKVLLYYSSCT
jgi:hypothetical protein